MSIGTKSSINPMLAVIMSKALFIFFFVVVLWDRSITYAKTISEWPTSHRNQIAQRRTPFLKRSFEQIRERLRFNKGNLKILRTPSGKH